MRTVAHRQLRTQDVSVSAVMPCFNGEPFVTAAVESILRQSRSPNEVVLFDNGSTDSTRDIFESFAKEHDHVRVVRLQSPVPAEESTNRAFGEAKCEYVVLFHHDDISREDRIEKQLELVDEEVAVVGSFMETIDIHGDPIEVIDYPIEKERFLQEMYRRNVVGLPSVLILKEAFDRVGGLRAAAGYAADYDLWLRLIEMGFGIRTVPEPLVQYRRHEGQASAQDDPRLLWCKFEVLLAAAFRDAGETDPLDVRGVADTSVFVGELEALVPEARELVNHVQACLEAGGLVSNDHRVLRDAALESLWRSGRLGWHDASR